MSLRFNWHRTEWTILTSALMLRIWASTSASSPGTRSTLLRTTTSCTIIVSSLQSHFLQEFSTYIFHKLVFILFTEMMISFFWGSMCIHRKSNLQISFIDTSSFTCICKLLSDIPGINNLCTHIVIQFQTSWQAFIQKQSCWNKDGKTWLCVKEHNQVQILTLVIKATAKTGSWQKTVIYSTCAGKNGGMNAQRNTHRNDWI